MEEVVPQHDTVEALSKSLQTLQRQNEALRQQTEEFDEKTSKYVNSIVNLNDQVEALQKENQELLQRNREFGAKNHRLEMDLEKITEEYRELYQLVHNERGNEVRQLVMREVELSNSLNDIHSGGLENLISRLKDTLNLKNGEIVELLEQNSKMKTDLLNSTIQYNNIISDLKEQLTALRAENSAFKSKKAALPARKMSGEEKNFDQKLERKQKELDLCQSEYEKLAQELLKCKKDMNRYKFESEWLKIIQENEQSQKECEIDFSSMRKLVDENIQLKKRVDQEVEKNAMLVRNNPGLMSQMEYIDLNSPMEELQVKYDRLATESEERRKELAILSKNMKETEEDTIKKEAEFTKYKAVTARVLDKLKKIMKSYLPCVNHYGFSEYGLDEEECKMVEGSGADASKEYDRMSSELVQKNCQIKKLEMKIKQIEEHNYLKEEIKSKEIEEVQRFKEENKKLLASVEALMEKGDNHSQGDCLAYPIPEEDQPVEENSEVRNEGQIHQEQEQVKARVEALGQLAVDLFQKYQLGLEIIREKDVIIAELIVELRVLSSHCKAKNFTLETLACQPLPQQQIQQSSMTNQDGDLERYREEYERLSKEITEVTAKAKSDLDLQEKEHEMRIAKLTKKFANLLAENKELQNKFRTLEQLYDDTLQSNYQLSLQ